MIDLKVKCTLCGKEESDEKVIDDAAEIIEKYGSKSEHYLTLLNVMSGKCLDSNEHSFIFDDSFLKEIEENVKKHKNNLEEIKKLVLVNQEFSKELNELEIKVEEMKSKINLNKDRIRNIYELNDNIENELGESSGCEKIDIWY